MNVRELSSELQSVARRELNEVSERVEDDLTQIKEWLRTQPHLNVRPDDQWLLNFLRNCKFSLEHTKERLDLFYTIKSLTPEYYTERNPFSAPFQEILHQGAFLPLPKTSDPSAPRVILMRPSLVIEERASFSDINKAFFMMFDILVNEDDNFIVSGAHVIQDARTMTKAHIKQFTPSMTKKMTTSIQHAYPMRIKGIHYINIPPFFENLYNVIKPFLTEKLKGRVNIHSNLEELYKIVPPSILPVEYGGEGGTLEEIRVDWKRKVESYQDWFLEDEQYRSDESKRPGRPKTVIDVFGIDAVIKQEVD